MSGTLQLLARLSVPTFIVSSTLAAGLGLTPRAILAPLRNPRLVATALLVNFVLSPGIAYLLIRLFHLERSYAIGLLLLSLAAGAPFLPKLAEAVRGDLPLAGALMVLLTAATILLLPLALPLLLPGARAGPWAVARPLVTMMALPLVAAMLVGPHLASFLKGSRALLGAVANVSLLLVLALFVGLNWGALRGVVGSGAGAISLVFIALVFTAGYMLGGASQTGRGGMGLAAAARNVAAALPAASSQSDPKVVVMLLVATLAEIVVLIVAGGLLRRRTPADLSPRVPATVLPDAAPIRDASGAALGGPAARH